MISKGGHRSSQHDVDGAGADELLDIAHRYRREYGPDRRRPFDHSGKPYAAVIDFGGLFGVGMRKIIDWSVLYFDLGEKKNVMVLDLGREQLKTALEYNESDKPIPV